MSERKRALVYGIGTNDADYPVKRSETFYIDGKRKSRELWCCPVYKRWSNMLARCYSEKIHQEYPTYKGCYVCNEWLVFSNFKNWLEAQNWEGKSLDKDLLIPGNKCYSPETCVLIDERVNNFLTESSSVRGNYLIGVIWHKRDRIFTARCKDGSGKLMHLGGFKTELEAHQAWLAAKQNIARKLAAEQSDPRVSEALISRFENYVAARTAKPEVDHGEVSHERLC